MKIQAMAHSVEYLELTRNSYGITKASHEATQYNPTELKGMVDSPYSLLTHYLRYLKIQTSDDLCITSYCDN
jgi:hypothetical protein